MTCDAVSMMRLITVLMCFAIVVGCATYIAYVWMRQVRRWRALDKRLAEPAPKFGDGPLWHPSVEAREAFEADWRSRLHSGQMMGGDVPKFIRDLYERLEALEAELRERQP